MAQILKKSILVFILIFSSAKVLAAASYQDGDVIGESEITTDASTSFFEAATGTRYGHVGVIFKEKQGWMVYEEFPPQAQIVTVQEFLSRSHGTYTVIRKSEALTAEQLKLVKSLAQDIVKRKVPYNYSQTSNSESMNCSEFVKAVFANAKLNVGKIETVGNLNLKTFHGYLWKIWKQASPETQTTDPVVTPASVMRTANWIMVDGTVDPHVTLTDAQLTAQWKKESALNGVAAEWGITPQQIEKLAQP